MRGTWYNAAAGLISGSSPLPEAVIKSIGIGKEADGLCSLRTLRRCLIVFKNFGLDGPKLEPDELVPLYGKGVVADGRPQKYLGSVKDWPIKSEPTIWFCFLMMLPFACQGKNTCAIPVMIKG